MPYKSFKLWVEERDYSVIEMDDDDIKKAMLDAIPQSVWDAANISGRGDSDEDKLMSRNIKEYKDGPKAFFSILGIQSIVQRIGQDGIESLKAKFKKQRNMTFRELFDTILGQNNPGDTVPFSANKKPTKTEVPTQGSQDVGNSSPDMGQAMAPPPGQQSPPTM